MGLVVVKGPGELAKLLASARRRGQEVGLHLTKGGLHGAHRANISKMAAECGVGVVAVLRPPGRRQGASLSSGRYDLGADLALAEQAGASVVFAPSASVVAGQVPPLSRGARALGEALEGEHSSWRPEQFAALLTKLLKLAGPCWAYLGEKHYQKLLLARRVVADLSLRAVVVACPTVRDPDGLALSSSNRSLGPAERQAAPVLYWALLAGKRAIDERGVKDAAEVRKEMSEVLAREPLLAPDYVEVRDPETLEPVGQVDREVRLLVAARLGGARLVDNLAAGRAARPGAEQASQLC